MLRNIPAGKPRGRGQRVGHALEKLRWGTRHPPEVTDMFTVFQDRGCAKRWRDITRSRAEARQEGLLFKHGVPQSTPRTHRLVYRVFGLGTCRKTAISPCHERAEARQEGVLVLTVTNPMNIASRLIDGNAHGYAVGISTKATKLVGIIEGGVQRT